MGTSKRIFYVEDDENLAFLTKDNLEMKGYTVTYFEDGLTAKDAFKTGEHDLCVLDIMLPGLDGMSLAQQIRDIDKEIPILFLSARNQKEDKLDGLRIGADDYITKPFSIEELILKIEVFLRRSKITETVTCTEIELGHFSFDSENMSLSSDKESYKLTDKESKLLQFFCANKNTILTRETILENLWGGNDYFSGRSLDVFISKLRKYLKSDPSVHIETIHGKGFRFNVNKVM